MNTHTPTPWVFCSPNYENGEPCICGYIFGDGGKVYIAKALSLADDVDPVATEEVRKANAAYIVKAVNAHAELVDILAKAYTMLEVDYGDPAKWQSSDVKQNQNVFDLMKAIEATLAKAGAP